jgi:GNAT superfamily N-acetyltransferase
MPVRLQWDGREVRSSWGMDVFLREEARGKGVGASLFTTWGDHVDVALGLGLTPSSYGLFKKLGYDDVGPVPYFQKLLDPVAAARRRVGEALARPLGAVLGLGQRLLHPEPEARGCRAEVRPITGFSAEYDTLWERCKGAYAMCVRRDQAYLNWKYVACPTRRYDRREARKDGLLTGFAVSRHEDYRGLRLGWLIDVFADPDDHDTKDALVGSVLDCFRREGVARAQAFSMNAALAGALLRWGFVRRRSPMQFCVRARVPSQGSLRDLSRWHVCFGDSDMDR